MAEASNTVTASKGALPPTQDAESQPGAAVRTDAAGRPESTILDVWPSSSTRHTIQLVLLVVTLFSAGLVALTVLATWLHDPSNVAAASGETADAIDPAWVSAQRARGIAGGAFAVLAFSAVGAWVIRADNPLDGSRRFLLGAGIILLCIAAAGWLVSLQLRPLALRDAYGIAGAIGAAGWFVSRYPVPASWFSAIFAAGILWVASLSAALALLFAVDLQSVRVVHLAGAVLFLMAATWAVVVLFRAADRYGVETGEALGKVSGITLVVLIGGAATLYGLWYSFVVDPTDQEPTLDVVVEATPVKLDEHTGVQLLVRAHNPTTTPIVIMKSPLEMQFGSTVGAFGAPPGTDTASIAGAAGEPDPTRTSSSPGTTTISETWCVKNLSSVDGQTGSRTSKAVADECRRLLFRNLNEDVPDADEKSTPGQEAQNQSSQHDCDASWRARQPVPPGGWARQSQWDEVRVSKCETEFGDIWRRPVILEPGSTAETYLVARSPDGTDVLQVSTSLVYGYSDRFIKLENPEFVAGQGGCPLVEGNANGLETYIRVAFDPITGLVETWDRRYIQVVAGAIPGETRRAHVCELHQSRVRENAEIGDPLLGRHEAVNHFLFGSTSS